MTKNCNGWLKLHRKLLNWEWYHDTNTRLVFIHLLLTANYEPSAYKGKIIQEGQRVYSIIELANEVGISVQKLRTSLQKLKATHEITCTSTNKGSVLTIGKWGLYQDKEHANNQQSNMQTNMQKSNTQVNTQDNMQKNDKVTCKPTRKKTLKSVANGGVVDIEEFRSNTQDNMQKNDKVTCKPTRKPTRLIIEKEDKEDKERKKESTPSSKRDEATQLYDQLEKPVSLLFKKWIEKRNERKKIITSIDDNLVFLQNLHRWKNEGYDLVHLMNHNLKNEWEQLYPPKHHHSDDVMERQRQNTIDQNNIDYLHKSFGGIISRKVWQSYYEKVPSAFACGVHQFVNLNSFNFIERIPRANNQPPLCKPKINADRLEEIIKHATDHNLQGLPQSLVSPR